MHSITDPLKELMPFLLLPIAIGVLRIVYNIVHDIAHGCYIADMEEEIKRKEKELMETKRKEKELIEEQEKINIDKDLQKYFNYKE